MTENDCPVCAVPALAASAGSLKQLGATDDEIAGALAFDANAVKQHFGTCAVEDLDGGDDDGDPLAGSDEQLQGLLKDSLENYRLAILQQNLVASTSALSVRLRAIVELGRRAQLKSECEVEGTLPQDVASWPERERTKFRDFLDAIIREHDSEVAQPPRNKTRRRKVDCLANRSAEANQITPAQEN